MKRHFGAVLAATAATALLGLASPPQAGAHRGELDGCGVHRDLERGGSHVHDYAAYCSCRPNYPPCERMKARDGGDEEDKGPAEKGSGADDSEEGSG